MAIIRAWLDGARGERLIVRVVAVDDVSKGEQRVTSAVGVDEATTIVRRWLGRVARLRFDDAARKRPARAGHRPASHR